MIASEDLLLTNEETHSFNNSTSLCICCLKEIGTFISLTGCVHADFLSMISIFNDNGCIKKIACQECHNVLVKINNFMLQVQESYNYLFKKIPFKYKLKQHKRVLTTTKILRHNILAMPINDDTELQNAVEDSADIKNIKNGLETLNSNTTSLVSCNLKSMSDVPLQMTTGDLNKESNVVIPETINNMDVISVDIKKEIEDNETSFVNDDFEKMEVIHENTVTKIIPLEIKEELEVTFDYDMDVSQDMETDPLTHKNDYNFKVSSPNKRLYDSDHSNTKSDSQILSNIKRDKNNSDTLTCWRHHCELCMDRHNRKIHAAAVHTSKKRLSRDSLNVTAACMAVSNGSKVKIAARNFNVPESTLKGCTPNVRRRVTFTQDEQRELSEFITEMSNKFYGMSKKQIAKITYDFAVVNNKINISSQEKDMSCIYKISWVCRFLKRNPELSLTPPRLRIVGFSKTELQMFFIDLEALMAKYNISADRIYSVDEMSVSTVHKSDKMYASKTKLDQYMTVVCAFSAIGVYIPPMLIYPAQKLDATCTSGPTGALYECNNSGMLNNELFLKWFHHFAKHSGASVQNPILLILDNDVSHQSLNVFKLSRNIGVHIMSIPPHTSYRIQPLEVALFGPLKSAYYREYEWFIKTNPLEKITQDVLALIFNKAYKEVATKENATKGFEDSGIHPLKPPVVFYNDELETAAPSVVEESILST